MQLQIARQIAPLTPPPLFPLFPPCLPHTHTHSISPQIIEWFEQFTDGVAQTHTELGESQQVAETLAKEVNDFETTTQVRMYIYPIHSVF